MPTVHPQFAPDRRQAHEAARLAKRLRHAAGRTITDYNLIEAGDRVTVCLSGGKDSWTLLDLLLSLQAKAPTRICSIWYHSVRHPIPRAPMRMRGWQASLDSLVTPAFAGMTTTLFPACQFPPFHISLGPPCSSAT